MTIDIPSRFWPRLSMQVLKQWRGEGSKKRAAEANIQESSRKRVKDDDGKHQSIEASIAVDNGPDQEYKIRGNSVTNKDLLNPFSPLPNHSASSPIATDPLPSPSSSIHPDRRANIFNATHTSAPSPASLQNQSDSPLSPLSPGPGRTNKVESEEQRPKLLNRISHPTLRIDTLPSESSMDPRSPSYTPIMSSNSNEKSHDSPSHDPRKTSLDSYRRDSNPPSRRQSDNMPPPPSVARTTCSENSTPKATSQPANDELERRQLSTTQSQVPLHDALNAFARSIMSAASLTVRRDVTKQQAVGQQRERDRHSKLKSTFLTLTEDTESRIEGIEKVSSGIEKQIDLSYQAQSKDALTLAAQLLKQAEVSDALPSVHDQVCLKDELAGIKADNKTARKAIDDITRDRNRFKDDLAVVKADLKADSKEIGYLKREAVMPGELRDKLRGLATKDELRDLVDKDELRRVTTDEVRKHVTEALIPTEKKLASLTLEDANLNQKIRGVEASTNKHRETTEGKNQEQSSRVGCLDASLNDLQLKQSLLELTVQEHKKDYATVKVNLEAQNRVLTDLNDHVRLDPSNDLPSLDTLVARNSDQIQSLQQGCEKLNEALQQTRDLQAASNMVSSPQVSKASVEASANLEYEICLIRQDLDTVKADQEKIGLIRTDLDSLINEENLKDVGVAQGFEAIEQSHNTQLEELRRLQTEVRFIKQSQASQTVSNHPPTPPLARASTSPQESDQQKLHDVEMELRKLTKTTQVLELFVKSQQQKFDGLTSDRVVQGMVHQMQQMYPQHPGPFIAWQTKVDSYLSGTLKDCLANLESQVAALVGADSRNDSKTQEITRFTTETRKIYFANLNSIKQDMEKLRDTAFCNPPQGPSDYGNRIDELAARVTTVEATYIKAIGEFQTNQTDLIGNVTQLQLRHGSSSTRSTPGKLTLTSRNSKSVEPKGTAIIVSQDIEHSDSSDTPLSQRTERGVRRDRGDRPPCHRDLKRRADESDDEDEDEGEEARRANARKIPKRRNVSGNNPSW